MRCSWCSEPLPPDTRSRYHDYCRSEERRVLNAERMRRLRTDPGYRAAESAREAARQRDKRATDPDWAEQRRAYNRHWMADYRRTA